MVMIGAPLFLDWGDSWSFEPEEYELESLFSEQDFDSVFWINFSNSLIRDFLLLCIA